MSTEQGQRERPTDPTTHLAHEALLGLCEQHQTTSAFAGPRRAAETVDVLVLVGRQSDLIQQAAWGVDTWYVYGYKNSYPSDWVFSRSLLIYCMLDYRALILTLCFHPILPGMEDGVTS